MQKLFRICVLLCLLLLLSRYLTQWELNLSRETNGLRKPDGIIVVGLVFYGRRDMASKMHRYLQRNMVGRGGWVDEVLWIANTNDMDDLRYLDEIQSQDPSRYKTIHILGDKLFSHTFYKAWEHLERGKYYVKIDDDIVWFDDNAIPQLVSRKLSHPDDFVVAANIINNPPLGFLHFHMGALHPYLPDISTPASAIPKSWKPSEHGFWDGPNDSVWELDRHPPHEGHRWLKVRDEKMLTQTPVYSLNYEVWGDSYFSWAIAAQMHYSFLQNIEEGSTDLYRFRPPWIMHGERIRINFMCVYADDILDTNITSWPRDRGDEDMIVLDLPQQLRRLVIVGDALAVHFQYVDQPALASTDLLSRYELLAQEQSFKAGGCNSC